MNKHTPGPWKIEWDNSDTSADNWYTVGPAEVHFRFGDERATANARLIAAAPEMLEALTVALGHMTCGMDGEWRDCDPVELIRAALAKAEGR